MKKDYIILLAWPETLCKQAGSWYDGISDFLNLSKDNYYKVGHAAIVLVNAETQECQYFDFGRYHSPFGHGRVRNSDTDHDLTIETKAEISNNGIDNIEQILTELRLNKACHGDGMLIASVTKGNFTFAYNTAKEIQTHSPSKYGPFVWKGTNCSRFVRTIALAGKPKLTDRIKLFFPLSISPTPIGNVKAIRKTYIINKVDESCLNVKDIQPQTI